jgi:AbrB family looped-hinge helix DNA binding protein
MTVLTVSAKGQVTLKKELLAHLGVKPGDRILVEKQPGGAVEVRAARPGRPIEDVYGLLTRPGQRVRSLQELTEAARASWAGER